LRIENCSKTCSSNSPPRVPAARRRRRDETAWTCWTLPLWALWVPGPEVCQVPPGLFLSVLDQPECAEPGGHERRSTLWLLGMHHPPGSGFPGGTRGHHPRWDRLHVHIPRPDADGSRRAGRPRRLPYLPRRHKGFSGESWTGVLDHARSVASPSRRAADRGMHTAYIGMIAVELGLVRARHWLLRLAKIREVPSDSPDACPGARAGSHATSTSGGTRVSTTRRCRPPGTEAGTAQIPKADNALSNDRRLSDPVCNPRRN
jgi:hypothetical protein